MSLSQHRIAARSTVSPTLPYLDRIYFLHITTNVGAPFPNIRTVLLDTRFLKNEFGHIFVGAAGAFDVSSDPLATLRFDPEGIRVGTDWNLLSSRTSTAHSSLSSIAKAIWCVGIDVPAKFFYRQPK